MTRLYKYYTYAFSVVPYRLPINKKKKKPIVRTVIAYKRTIMREFIYVYRKQQTLYETSQVRCIFSRFLRVSLLLLLLFCFLFSLYTLKQLECYTSETVLDTTATGIRRVFIFVLRLYRFFF